MIVSEKLFRLVLDRSASGVDIAPDGAVNPVSILLINGWDLIWKAIVGQSSSLARRFSSSKA